MAGFLDSIGGFFGNMFGAPQRLPDLYTQPNQFSNFNPTTYGSARPASSGTLGVSTAAPTQYAGIPTSYNNTNFNVSPKRVV